MSAIGAAFSRVLGAIGGPTTAAIMAGGLVLGALGGGLVAGGGSSQPASATGSLAVYPCPGTGAPLTMIQAGQKLLATGRTEDSGWLRIHFPEPGRTEAWVEAGPLEVQGQIAGLPVAECAPENAAEVPPLVPGPSLTAVENNPPSAAPTATPGPSPSGTPDNAPSLTALSVSTTKLSYDTGDYCPNAVKKATFTVKATDDIGIEHVALFWRKPGAGSYAETAMTRTAGNAKKGTWAVTLGTVADGITTAGTLSFYAVGTDSSGATKRIPVKGTDSISVKVCVNTGPTISGVKSSSGSSLFWDPVPAPGKNCQTATDITATIKDSDGVKSATLFFKRPGSSSWSSKAMDSRTIKGKWYANLDTLGDKISIPNPPTGSLRWYIKAVDGAGFTSQLSSRTITVKRCDTEAQFVSQWASPPNSLCLNTDTNFYGRANDPDGIGASSAVLVYTYQLADGTKRTKRKDMKGSLDGDWYYSTTLRRGANWATGRVFMTWHIETRDQYGGKSRSQDSQINVSSGC